MVDNVLLIRDVLTLCEAHSLSLGLISIDLQKAFDCVHHSYLFQTLAAFGFGPSFTALIQILYNEITSLVKVNNKLTTPMTILRGICQGCQLTGVAVYHGMIMAYA